MKTFLALASCLFIACIPLPDSTPDGGGGNGGSSLVCDEHPELSHVWEMPCVVDSDCTIPTVCVTVVCDRGFCAFGVSAVNGTPCENGGLCDDRRCCHSPLQIP